MATRLEELTSAVRQRWLSDRLGIVNVSPAEIEAVEQRIGGPLPSEHRFVLENAGVPAAQDGLGFRFWHPSEFKLGASSRKTEGGRIGNGTAYIFADYLDESWWFAISFAGPSRGMVFRELGDETSAPEPPIGDICTFLSAYIEDNVALYGRRNVTE